MSLNALTLHRPWPWAVFLAGKDIENRTWPPPAWLIGKPLAIHAGKTWDAEGAAWIAEEFGIEVPPEAEHPSGVIVGLVTVTGSRTEAGDSAWFVGPIGWDLAEPVLLPEPVACRGMQKLWRVPADVTELVRDGYAEARGRPRRRVFASATPPSPEHPNVPGAYDAPKLVTRRYTTNSRGPGQDGVAVAINPASLITCPKCGGVRVNLGGPHAPRYLPGLGRVDCTLTPIPEENHV